MRISVAAIVFLTVGGWPLIAQTPAASPREPGTEPSQSGSSTSRAETAPGSSPKITDAEIGFSYSLPAEWETVASKDTKPDVPYPQVEAAKKGDACTEVELTARHGSPSSVVVVVALPFYCYGQPLTAKNLPDFAAGVEEGLKRTFEVTDSAASNYSLGSHNMWLERAHGAVKGQPDSKYTLEIACTVLSKGAACWMTMAADAAALEAFEQGAVSLESDAPATLVPATAFLPDKP